MKSKIICNILIILFILVAIAVSIFAAWNKLDWKAVVIPLVLACGVLLMYQAVIYKGTRDKQLINQVPLTDIINAVKGNSVNVISTGNTNTAPGNTI